MKKLKSLLPVLLLLNFALIANAQLLKKELPNKLVVLTFDDAVISHATYVAPLLKKYGFGATFFVCEFGGSPAFSDKTKYMTWEQIAGISKMGFEIGNHTWHHTHVNKMDTAKLTAELEYIEQKCAEYHIPQPVSFAYPAYDTSSKVISVFHKKGYQFARAGFNRYYNPQKDHPYFIPGFTSLATNKASIDSAMQATASGKILVLTFHGVPDTAHDWVNTPPDIFESYLKYLKDNHYTVIALRDLAAYINVDTALNLPIK